MASRTQQKQATRQALKDAALRVWGREGVDASSITAVAAAAGVAHGTFYVHFESKEQLLDELLADFNQAFADALVARWAGLDPRDLPALVGATADAFLDHWSAHRAFIEVYAERAAGGLPAGSPREGINPPMMQLLSARLASVVDEPELVAHALLAMWLRLGLQFLGRDLPRTRVRATLVRLTLGALGITP